MIKLNLGGKKGHATKENLKKKEVDDWAVKLQRDARKNRLEELKSKGLI